METVPNKAPSTTHVNSMSTQQQQQPTAPTAPTSAPSSALASSAHPIISHNNQSSSARHNNINVNLNSHSVPSNNNPNLHHSAAAVNMTHPLQPAPHSTSAQQAELNPHTLGREFVRQYYTILNKGPHILHRSVSR